MTLGEMFLEESAALLRDRSRAVRDETGRELLAYARALPDREGS